MSKVCESVFVCAGLAIFGVGWKLGLRWWQVLVLGVWQGVWLWLVSFVVVVQSALLSRARRPCFLICGYFSGLPLGFGGEPVFPPSRRCATPSPISSLSF